NTEDTAVQCFDKIHEYNVDAKAAWLSREQIRQAQINGLTQAFLGEQEKDALIQRVAKG
ncbi:adenosine deaminase, partial [Klebsiella pneumoniae]|nr:adenosine deaminase [Klebsiella pneumoniae]